MPAFLPPRPQYLISSLSLEQRVVSVDFDDPFMWDLLSQVNFQAVLDGKSLLQCFCEAHKGWHFAYSSEEDYPLFPAHSDQIWPEDLHMDNYRKIWLFAVLVANSPNPFSWKTKEGWDVLDFVIESKCAPILNQLLRHHHCPSLGELDGRKSQKSDLKWPWLTWLSASMELTNAQVVDTVEVLLKHGLNPEAKNHKNQTALMVSHNFKISDALLKKGANPFAQQLDGQGILQKWMAPGYYASLDDNQNHICENLTTWLSYALPQDAARARQEISLAALLDFQKGKSKIPRTIAQYFHQPLYQLTDDQGQNGLFYLETHPKRATRNHALCLNHLIRSMPVHALMETNLAGQTHLERIFHYLDKGLDHYKSDDLCIDMRNNLLAYTIEQLPRMTEKDIEATQLVIDAYRTLDHAHFDFEKLISLEQALLIKTMDHSSLRPKRQLRL